MGSPTTPVSDMEEPAVWLQGFFLCVPLDFMATAGGDLTAER